jgi:hypothetical protein
MDTLGPKFYKGTFCNSNISPNTLFNFETFRPKIPTEADL